MTDRRPSTRASPPYAAVVGRLLPMLKVGKGPVAARHEWLCHNIFIGR